MSILKRILAGGISFAVTVMPFAGLAAENESRIAEDEYSETGVLLDNDTDEDVGSTDLPWTGPVSGKGNDNITWTLDEYGTLTISGTGAMPEFFENEYYGYRKYIKNVIVEEGITAVASHAFDYINTIRSVTLPDGLTEIGDGAFEDCASLRSIIIPDSVVSIGANAFEGCSSLANVTLSNSLTRIESQTFINCTSLDSITLPEGITSIGNNAFEGCRFTRVTLPESLTSMEKLAFEPTYSFEDIYYNGTEEEWSGISKSWFDGEFENINIHCKTGTATSGTCGSDISWTLDDNGTLTVSGSGELNDLYSTAFYEYKDSIKNVIIGEGIDAIGADVFEECAGIESVSLPDTLAAIGYEAFRGCIGLKEITLPDSLTTIGFNEFLGSGLTGVAIPENVTSIDHDAFSDTEYYRDMRNWENGALYIGKNLIELRAKPGDEEYTVKDGTTLIGGDAFEGDGDLKNIVLPESLKGIGEGAFFGCSTLSGITIPSGVDRIGDSAFSGCTGLKSIVLPTGIEEIASRTFYECEGLENITIPESVKSIGARAFYGCTALKSITIPAGVEEIDLSAFSDCDSLGDVYYKGSEEQWEAVITGSGRYLENAVIHYNGQLYNTEITASKTTSADGKTNVNIALSSPKDGTIIAAGYDEYGRIKDMVSIAASKDNTEYSAALADEGVSEIRVMLWNGADSIKALAPVASVQ